MNPCCENCEHWDTDSPLAEPTTRWLGDKFRICMGIPDVRKTIDRRGGTIRTEWRGIGAVMETSGGGEWPYLYTSPIFHCREWKQKAAS